MTILVGVYCTDGVVLGADSAATFSHGPTPTIGQFLTKIDTIDDKLLFATTGSVGLGQRFHHHLTQEWQAKGFQKTIHEVSTSITKRTLEDFANTGVQRHPQFGLNFGALLAAPVGDNHRLIEYDSMNFQPEFKDYSILFVSMGSGQPIADPFLGFIRRVFWSNQPPILREGIFGAIWTLEHTIKVTPGMVGGPSTIGVLERVKSKWRARILSDDELGEHKEHVNSVEEHVAQYRGRVLTQAEQGEAADVPAPPKPKA